MSLHAPLRLLALASALAAPAAQAGIVNIQGFGAAGAGANIFNYPVAVGTVVDLFNPVLISLQAGTYELSSAWGQSDALYDTWNFQSAVAGSWLSHYVVAEVLAGGVYSVLVDGLSSADPTCHNHFCAWDTRDEATAAFLATPAYRFTLAHDATVALVSADYFLPDNLGGISLLLAPVDTNAAVPEPGALTLSLGGLALLAGARRRRPAAGCEGVQTEA